MGKRPNRGRDSGDGSRFIRLPWVVIDSPGYRALSRTARSLLIDIARQFNGHNNGKLVACRKYLAPMGWLSNDVITRARIELLECELMLETRRVRGQIGRAGMASPGWLSM